MSDLSCDIAGVPCTITIERGAFVRLDDWLATVTADAFCVIAADAHLAACAWFNRPMHVPVPIVGEPLKTYEGIAPIYDLLPRMQVTRDSVLVAIGGGSVSDALGFVAATWLRGIRWVTVPTTLLAMVDAAIGGKVALNWRSLKNQIGAFHQPRGILIDPDVLATLPERDYLSGVGEILKTACLDAQFFLWLEEHWTALLERDPSVLDRAIADCVRIKRDIVIADPTEQGLRRRLNLGHTMGHALESHWQGTVPHGLCVAYGLMIEAKIGVEFGFTDPHFAENLECLATELVAQPASGPIPEFPGLDALGPYLRADKKATTSGEIRWQFPVRPGEVREEILTHRLPGL